MGITLLTLLIVAAGVIGYLHFSTRKEETETTSEPIIPSNPTDELQSVVLNQISEKIEDQISFPINDNLNVTVSASESIGLQTNLTFDNTVTYVESQITDAVTTKPVKPKKKRGRKPTKKVKK